MATENDNNGLYFIVGALLVAVLGIGLFYMMDTDGMNNNPDVIERTERTIERTVDQDRSDSSLSVDVDDNGFTARSEQN